MKYVIFAGFIIFCLLLNNFIHKNNTFDMRITENQVIVKSKTGEKTYDYVPGEKIHIESYGIDVDITDVTTIKIGNHNIVIDR